MSIKITPSGDANHEQKRPDLKGPKYSVNGGFQLSSFAFGHTQGEAPPAELLEPGSAWVLEVGEDAPPRPVRFR